MRVGDWVKVPVDDVGYFRSDHLLKMSDLDLRALVAQCEATRYQGWRNPDNRWRRLMGLDDDITGKQVIDFGCGLGIEALQLARAGATVTVADVHATNVELAVRVLLANGFSPWAELVTTSAPWVETDEQDIFYANGVIHHIPYAKVLMQHVASSVLVAAGEARLMLYTDQAWADYVGEFPTETHAAAEKPSDFATFIDAMDGQGTHADWYTADKVVEEFGDWFHLDSFDLIDDRGHYAAVRLTAKVTP